MTLTLLYISLFAWVAALVHAAQRRSWGWFVLTLLLPGIGMITYWLWFALKDRAASA